MPATYHLLNDIGMHKRTVLANYLDNDRPPSSAHVLALLKRVGQRYTVAELLDLREFFWTASDECAAEGEYGAARAANAQRKIDRGILAQARVAELVAAEGVDAVAQALATKPAGQGEGG